MSQPSERETIYEKITVIKNNKLTKKRKLDIKKKRFPRDIK